ncbi:MAG TPA: protein-methionine-sulfoxide reductase heme-binding subunit MsrQ [Bryobacteraceae bacterium]|nr:protein-methionine-sulfoxide reductase heme-binding subunit MsrQ [Bryobacteraceae bacterium]
MIKKILLSGWTRALLFVLCLVPFFDLGWDAYTQNLTANPVEYITHKTGDWTIRFLMITLSVTPLRLLFHQPQLVRFRRMFGLFAFFYATLHFTTWFCLDKFFDFQEMGKDILKRPFITLGLAALLMLIPLAVTSTNGWVRRLGFKRWQKLHRLVYVIALVGVIHYYWLVKSDVRLPLMYGAIWVALMSVRAVERSRNRRQAAVSV